LGYPKFDPHGDPIPDKNGKLPVLPSILLSEGKIGQAYRISGVSENSDTFLKYLKKIGLGPGAQVTITEMEEFDGSMKILIDDKKEIILSRQAAANLFVTS
jgi:DtxR family Mn-dependent transcriptional regulator